MRRERHPRITPLRALDLLRRLDMAGNGPSPGLLSDLRDALNHHVRSGLAGRRRR